MSEQEELATGGAIEPRGIAYVSDDPGPEIVFLPRNAQVYPNPPKSAPYIASFTLDDVVYKPSNAFPTLDELKAFVRKWVREDVREELDELAAEMRENPAFQASKVQ